MWRRARPCWAFPRDRAPRSDLRVVFAAAETDPPTYPSVDAIFGRGLTALGHDVTGVFYGPPSGRPWAGNAVWTVTKPARGRAPVLARSVVREWVELGRAFQALEADAVIVRDDPVMALAASRHASTLGPMILQISHLTPEEVAGHGRAGIYGSRAGNLLKAGAAQRLRALALRRAERVIVMTPEMANALSLSADRTVVIPEGVDAEWTADITPGAMRDQLTVDLRAPLVVYAGTLNRVRRLEVLIEGFAVALRTFPDAVLAIAGPGREPGDTPWLVARAHDLGIERSVRFIGPISHARVAALMDAADVIVSPLPNTPVLRCNSPTKLFEAMQRGRPVIASDIPEQSRVVSEAGCGLVVPHAAASYGHALTALLSDPAMRSQMGAAGRSWVLADRTYAQLTLRVAAALSSLPRGSGAA